MTVIVNYRNKIVRKQFQSRKKAERYLSGLKGEFIGYLEDGTFAVAKL